MKLQQIKNTFSFKIIQNKNIVGFYIISKQKKVSRLIYKTSTFKNNINIMHTKKNISKGFINKIKCFF
jgi:hypothetical protein